MITLSNGAKNAEWSYNLPIMLTESDVISAVCDFIEGKGFRVQQRLAETEHGEDILALAPDGIQRVTIEAKGETSSKPTTSRYGNEFNSAQVRNHVSRAFYSAAQHFSSGALTGIALPKNRWHLKCVERILPALRELGIEVFWVLPDRSVEILSIWSAWGRPRR